MLFVLDFLKKISTGFLFIFFVFYCMFFFPWYLHFVLVIRLSSWFFFPYIFWDFSLSLLSLKKILFIQKFCHGVFSSRVDGEKKRSFSFFCINMHIIFFFIKKKEKFISFECNVSSSIETENICFCFSKDCYTISPLPFPPITLKKKFQSRWACIMDEQ